MLKRGRPILRVAFRSQFETLTIPYYVVPFEISSRNVLFPSGDLANQLGCDVSGVTGP